MVQLFLVRFVQPSETHRPIHDIRFVRHAPLALDHCSFIRVAIFSSMTPAHSCGKQLDAYLFN